LIEDEVLSSVSWCRTTEALAVVVDDGYDANLYVVEPGAERSRRVLGSEEIGRGEDDDYGGCRRSLPVISPDGRFVAVSVELETVGMEGDRSEVRVYNVLTGGIAQTFLFPAVALVDVAWSPCSKMLCLLCLRQHLYTGGAEEASVVLLSIEDGSTRSFAVDLYPVTPSWSNSGKSIVFATSRQRSMDDNSYWLVPDGKIMLLSLETGALTCLTPDSVGHWYPCFCGQDELIAFETAMPDGRFCVQVMELESTSVGVNGGGS
jgi:Tol biopolymer transport system component